jgi:hypothetical protein
MYFSSVDTFGVFELQVFEAKVSVGILALSVQNGLMTHRVMALSRFILLHLLSTTLC